MKSSYLAIITAQAAFCALVLYSMFRLFFRWWIRLRETLQARSADKLLDLFRRNGQFYRRQSLFLMCLLVVDGALKTWRLFHFSDHPSPLLVTMLFGSVCSCSGTLCLDGIDILLSVTFSFCIIQVLLTNARITVLWVLRDKLGLDMSEYRLDLASPSTLAVSIIAAVVFGVILLALIYVFG